jgi:hypothetical protein
VEAGVFGASRLPACGPSACAPARRRLPPHDIVERHKQHARHAWRLDRRELARTIARVVGHHEDLRLSPPVVRPAGFPDDRRRRAGTAADCSIGVPHTSGHTDSRWAEPRRIGSDVVGEYVHIPPRCESATEAPRCRARRGKNGKAGRSLGCGPVRSLGRRSRNEALSSERARTGANIAGICHAEGRGFESHHPL